MTMTNEQLSAAVYELAEAVRRLVVTMQASLEVSASAEFPGEMKEFIFSQFAPALPEVLEHVESVKAQIDAA